jgi:hypothetical protein
MVDMKTFYAENPQRIPVLSGTTDCRNWISNCTCPVCMKSKRAQETKLSPLFGDYNSITLESWDMLSRHQYLLLPKEIKAFVFRTRTWGE